MQDRLRILEDLNMLYIRQMALSLEDTELQRKLDHEIRMRDGACKLLAACSQREQALEATKSLLVCNSRILSYMGELQRRKEAQVLGKRGRRPSDSCSPADRTACRGRVCISDLRIPLMWKDTEYFKNKGDLHRWAVFLLLQLGEHIQDTETVVVDRTLTDISFQSNVLFADAGPDFELRLELYGACMDEEGALTGAPKRLATKLSSSLGRSSGRRVRASLENAGGSGSSPILLPTPAVGGPRYHLLAHSTLTLAAVHDGFRTHDLSLVSQEENPAWLPLYGSICCRLVAQPQCMVQPTVRGALRVQDTRVWSGELEPGRSLTLSISNQCGEETVVHTLQTESRAALQSWREALRQLFFDMSRWKQCCEEIMKIEIPAPRKPPQALAKQGSLYHEMAIEPLDDIAAVTDILAQRKDARLEMAPPWLVVFSGQPASPPSPAPPPWGRPRTLSLDSVPSDRAPGVPRSAAPRPPQTRGLFSKGAPHMWFQSAV
ncbi:rhotekin isoform X4 [Suncus etruscus]|uniref:rhotekin isoform X4 n=1 Tax=Suncus etruscus TaxID=109475 RepID=UPI0021100398|nr:rhotekin isoform X4 [Suncus etruscus]